MEPENKKVAVMRGDGIGPEIIKATMDLVSEVCPSIEWRILDHEEAYTPSASQFWETLSSCDAILKAPTTTPQGTGRRSLNVMLRTALGLWGNIRPVRSFDPFIESARPVDMTIVRENEEDLYVGMEYQQSAGQAHAVKIATPRASTRLSHYAFALATAQQKNRVTCMTKDNIMKITDGMFARSFRNVSVEYPKIKADHKIIDIGAALIATRPEEFEIVVTTNLYGDIISDIAAQVAGSVGLAGSANIGSRIAMFEAIHGSAPDIAGLDLANPSGLISAAVMMLSYLGYAHSARQLEGAWLRTIEDGILTKDLILREHVGRATLHVGTRDFSTAVKERIGLYPSVLKPSPAFPSLTLPSQPIEMGSPAPPPSPSPLVGVDIFIRHNSGSESEKMRTLSKASGLSLLSVFHRGVNVEEIPLQSFESDQWRYRLMASNPPILEEKNVWAFISDLSLLGFEVLRVETLRQGLSVPMYSE